MFHSDRRPSFYGAVGKLIGHVIGGAVLFASIAALAWLLSYGIALLHARHPFSQTVFAVLHNFEVGILYLDAGLSGMVLLIGAFRFIREITGEHL